LQSIEEAVDCITVRRAYTSHTALAALDSLLAQNISSDPLFSSIKPTLVILDSIGAVIAPVLGAGGSGTHLQGHVLLATMGILLKQVAQQLNAAVLVTNHMVGGGGGDRRDRGDRGAHQGDTSNFSDNENKRPALGESWNHQCHCRVQLSLPPSEGQPWSAVVRTSTMITPGKSIAHYWLASSTATVVPPPNSA
jgi:Rad51